MTTKTTPVRSADGSELEKLRDVVIRCHELSGGAYLQTDKELLQRIHRMTDAMIDALPAMAGFMGRGGPEAHRDIAQNWRLSMTDSKTTPVEVTTRIITISYKAGHSHKEKWDRTKYFCMECGEQAVWAAQDGDYYQGERHMCALCGFSWNMPDSPSAPMDANDQRWEAIK